MLAPAALSLAEVALTREAAAAVETAHALLTSARRNAILAAIGEVEATTVIAV